MAALYIPKMLLVKHVTLRQIEGIFLSRPYKNIAFKATCVLVWANLIFFVAIMFSLGFACVRWGKTWYPKIESGKCINTAASIIATSAINII